MHELIALKDDESLSERYLRYACGLLFQRQYRHQEIEDVATLLPLLNLSLEDDYGFYYGYSLPQLNKEFDLLKIGREYVVNIELKSQMKAPEDLLKQLRQNAHYLKMLHREVFCFTFVTSEKRLFQYVMGNLVEIGFDALRGVILHEKPLEVDLDRVFDSSNVLVSPLESPKRFIEGDYLLSEHQEHVKIWVQRQLPLRVPLGIVGGFGTGKTLLIYDLLKESASKGITVLVYRGPNESAHQMLLEHFPNLRIEEVSSMHEETFVGATCVYVDEASQIRAPILQRIAKLCQGASSVYSYDPQGSSEQEVESCAFLNGLCGDRVIKLTHRIRANKEMALFTSCLQDLSRYTPQCEFPHVEIRYVLDEASLEREIAQAESEGYVYYEVRPVEGYVSSDHEVNRVVAVMDQTFCFEERKLKENLPEDVEKIYIRRLCKAIASAREQLRLLIADKALLGPILKLFKTSR